MSSRNRIAWPGFDRLEIKDDGDVAQAFGLAAASLERVLAPTRAERRLKTMIGDEHARTRQEWLETQSAPAVESCQEAFATLRGLGVGDLRIKPSEANGGSHLFVWNRAGKTPIVGGDITEAVTVPFRAEVMALVDARAVNGLGAKISQIPRWGGRRQERLAETLEMAIPAVRGLAYRVETNGADGEVITRHGLLEYPPRPGATSRYTPADMGFDSSQPNGVTVDHVQELLAKEFNWDVADTAKVSASRIVEMMRFIGVETPDSAPTEVTTTPEALDAIEAGATA